MKKIILFVAVGLVLLIPSCSSVTVSYDYDKTANFGAFKTYAYTPEALSLPVGDLDRDRVLAAVDAEMAARGFTKSDSPDALIDLIIQAKERVEATATNSGGGYYGRYGYGGGFSTTHIDYNQYVDGTLFINFIDKSSEKMIWQGRGTKTIDEHASPEKKETNIKYAVKTIYAKFPVKPVTTK
ncbi:MAG TPA: DUF4136 domain-containing protein [Chryseolinea sp.]|nr:DUF4136 domain-containing protein [Chryseolinea sp.]